MWSLKVYKVYLGEGIFFKKNQSSKWLWQITVQVWGTLKFISVYASWNLNLMRMYYRESRIFDTSQITDEPLKDTRKQTNAIDSMDRFYDTRI